MNNYDLNIALNNIPLDNLKTVIQTKSLDVVLSGKKEDIFNEIKRLEPEITNKLVKEYKYAGKTAACWFFSNQIEIESEQIKSLIEEKYTTDIYVSGRVRPDLSSTPQLIFFDTISINQKDVCIFMFAYQGQERRVLIDFEPQILKPTFFDYVIVRPGTPIVIEIRGSSKMTSPLLIEILKILDLERDKFQRLKLDNDTEIDTFSQLLNAKLQTASHKLTEGDYDLMEVSACPQIEDLNLSEQYKNDLADIPSRKKILVFDYEYNNEFCEKEKVTLEINTNSGNLWFRSMIGEQIIEFVHNKLGIANLA